MSSSPFPSPFQGINSSFQSQSTPLFTASNTMPQLVPQFKFAQPSSEKEINNLQNLTMNLATQQPNNRNFLSLESIISSNPVTADEITQLTQAVQSATQSVTPVEKVDQFKNTTADDVLNRIKDHQATKPVYKPFVFSNGKTLQGRMIKWTPQDIPNDENPITSLEQLSEILKKETEESCNLPTDKQMYLHDPEIPIFSFGDEVVVPQITIPSPQTIKSKIIEPFIDQGMTVYQSLRQGIPITWERLFNESAPHLKLISDILEEDEKINGMWYPLKQDLFKAFRYCPLTVPGTNIPYVKAVIIGMDPYPQLISYNRPKAVGMSFSVRRDDEDIPFSLRKIFQELELEYSSEGYRIPSHGDLTDIAVQGVLFLNKCPTFTPKFGPNEHIHLKKDFWKGFILNVINMITEICPKAIFVMWGADAQKLDGLIPAKMKRLMAAHPANRNANGGFLGCGHFKTINETLISTGQTPINWQT